MSGHASRDRAGAGDRSGAHSTTHTGRLGEAIAAAYLELAGYRVLGRNVRCGPLEVDLIVRRGEVVAFVEVRLRTGAACERPEETIGWRKRALLGHAAEAYARREGWPAGSRARLDVVAVHVAGAGLTLRHLPGFASLHAAE